MAISLQVASGRNAGQEIPVRSSRFLIGRAEDCHLRAHSDQVSRYHCALLIESDGVFVRDYGSRNGTFVDGQRIVNQLELHDGQKLQIGPMSFIVRIRPGASAGKDTVLGKAGSDTMHAAGAKSKAPGEKGKTVKQAAQAVHDAPEPVDVLQFLNEPEPPTKLHPRGGTTLPSVEDYLAAEKAAAKKDADGEDTPQQPASSDDQTRDAALEGLKKFYTPKKQ